MKLSSLPGWPGRKPEKALQITDDFLVHQRLGWNAAIDACDRVVDEEALEEQIWDYLGKVGTDGALSSRDVTGIAKALAQNASKWVVVKEGK